MATFQIYNNNDAYGEGGPFEIEAEDFEAACAKLADEIAETFAAWAFVKSQEPDSTPDNIEDWCNECVREMRIEFIAGLENVTQCLYCGAALAGGHGPVPAVDDDATWAREAEAHEDDCAWVRTRAHRID